MLNDIQVIGDSSIAPSGSVKYNVAASATLIVPGEPVAVTLGTMTVTKMATNKPVVATDYLAGIAVSTSTNTASVAGTVDVMPLKAGNLYMISANDSTAINTQAKYNALLGYRVLLDLTGTYPNDKYTGLVADGATSGCVIMPNDITKNPGKIVFAIRNGVSNLS